MDRASDYESEGCRFESCAAYLLLFVVEVGCGSASDRYNAASEALSRLQSEQDAIVQKMAYCRIRAMELETHAKKYATPDQDLMRQSNEMKDAAEKWQGQIEDLQSQIDDQKDRVEAARKRL